MQRLVPYDDDDEDVSNIPIAPIFAGVGGSAVASAQLTLQSDRRNNVASTISHPSAKVTGRPIYLEDVAFKKAFQKAENLTNKPPSTVRFSNRVDINAKSFINLGEMPTDGPWAPFPSEEEQEESERNKIEAEYAEKVLSNKRLKSQAKEEQQNVTTAVGAAELQPAAMKEAAFSIAATTAASSMPSCERHGKVPADYQGRVFTDERRWPPKQSFFITEDEELVVEEDTLDDGVQKLLGRKGKSSTDRVANKGARECKIPTQSAPPPAREYIGHTMGISKVRLYGCLALTAGMDGSVMIWDTSLADDISGATAIGLADERGAIQTYWGHEGKAVKDCAFQNSSPAIFASCGFDGYARVWDTETGKVINQFHAEAKRVPVNAARFKPDDDNNLLLAFGDRRLRHWDIREPGGDKPAQTYDFHQSSVSSVNFCEHGLKFVSTGEDRKMLVWEWRVPSPVKIISELWLPSMPTTATHPSTMSYVSVGLDNKLFQFKVHPQTGVVGKSGECSPDGFKVSGFACEPAFSACGNFLACGDGTGSIHILRSKAAFAQSSASGSRFTVHKIVGAHTASTPVSCVQFHPCFDGVLLSVGWDGKLKWWK